MPRLYLFAEGQTEQTFADTVLKPHLANFGVYMSKPVLIAHTKKKGRVHRGGGRNYEPIKNDIQRFLKQEPGQDVFFTTMIDLYRLPSQFPGRDESEKLRNDPYRRVQTLEESWAADIGGARFIPFIQLHEYEAYLFVEVTQLRAFYPNMGAQITKLKEISDSVSTPELINDGEHTSPSKRIIKELPPYEGAKTTVGPQVGESIGLSEIRARCPHFNDWLTKLEQLGSARETAT